MRYIKTTNSSVEFIEKDNNGVIVNARAFQFGSIYFLIKNGKVTFYSADSETPYRSDIWTVDIPVTIDDVEYSDVEAVSAALGAVMNSDFADRLDEVEEGLATEEGRAQAAEEALDSKIDSETARSISAETALQNAITAENTRAMTAEGVIAADLASETARAKGEEHRLDDRISGFETSLTNEIVRAHLAEAALSGAIDTEVSRAQSEEARIEAKMDAFEDMVTAEANRAKAAESAITDNLNAEISRAQNAEQTISGAVDAEISRAQAAESAISDNLAAEVTRATNAESAITANLNAEVTRAQSAETANANAINSEVSRAQAAESALTNAINAEVTRAEAAEGVITANLAAEVSRAQSAETANADAINSEVTRATTAEQGISGAVDVAVANLNNVKADKANAVASVQYISTAKTINFYDISGNVLSTVDSTDFVKDGMVSNVEVSNGKLVITFNTDAGKEAIEIPLTQIFDPANYYNKADIDALMSGKTDTAVTMTISGDVLTVSGNLNTHVSNADIHVTTGDKATWSDKYTQAQVDAKVSALSGAIDDEASQRSADDSVLSGAIGSVNASLTDHTADTDIHVTTADKTNWADKYTKSEVDDAISAATSGKMETSAMTAYTTTAVTDALNTVVTAHTADTTVHVTSGDKATWNAKQDTLVAGENITISGNVISAAGGDLSNYYTKAEVDEMSEVAAQGINDLNANKLDVTAYTPTDLSQYWTSAQTQSAITQSVSGKQDTLTAGTGIDITSNVISVTGGGSSVTVVQTTGTSTTDVMSQDAVTTALSGKSATGHTHTSGDVTNLSTVLAGYATTSTTNSINGTLTAHTGNSTIHVTSSEKSTWSGKQDALVSGTNIKTINGTSLLGSGDITVNLNIWSGTAADYAQISPKDPNTLYLVY